MKPIKRLYTTVLMLLLIFFVSGCGQKGPLKRPEAATFTIAPR